MPATLAPKPLTTGMVARRLGVTNQSVRNWVDAGWLRATLTPTGRRLIDPAEVDRFAETVAAKLAARMERAQRKSRKSK